MISSLTFCSSCIAAGVSHLVIAAAKFSSGSGTPKFVPPSSCTFGQRCGRKVCVRKATRPSNDSSPPFVPPCSYGQFGPGPIDAGGPQGPPSVSGSYVSASQASTSAYGQNRWVKFLLAAHCPKTLLSVVCYPTLFDLDGVACSLHRAEGCSWLTIWIPPSRNRFHGTQMTFEFADSFVLICLITAGGEPVAWVAATPEAKPAGGRVSSQRQHLQIRG